jgi:hypothetical protein
LSALEPTTGRLQYPNAGHDVPYVSTRDSVAELRARGMPLGLVPGSDYEQKEALLAPGQDVGFYSDGLARSLIRTPMYTLSRRTGGGSCSKSGCRYGSCIVRVGRAY